MIAGTIWWFAERVFQSLKGPDAVDEVPSGAREGLIQPWEADIEGFHLL